MQVLLLEAYEQLEMDTAKEIDKALAKEREERKTVERKAEFLQVGLPTHPLPCPSPPHCTVRLWYVRWHVAPTAADC